MQYFVKCLILIGLLPGMRGTAQPVSKHTALNHYVNFTNECIHTLTVIRDELESFQQESLAWYQEPNNSLPSYEMHDKLHSFSYFDWRQGVCTRIPHETDPVNNLQSLYKLTKQESSFISEPQRARINQFRDELMFIVIQCLELSDSLESQLKRSRLQEGANLKWVFAMLRRAEILYHDFQAMRDKLEFALREAGAPAPVELGDLHRLVFAAQQLIHAVRHEGGSDLLAQHRALEQAIQTASANQDAQIAKMKSMDLYHHRDLTGYRYLIQYGRKLLAASKACINSLPKDPVVEAYGRTYFCYNQQLLPLYNHYHNGMVAYFNHFVRFANTHLLQQIEETPWFRARAEPDVQEEVPPIDTARLEAAIPEPIQYRNHLVFLLDISASMNKPEKLPLLKSALIELLPLLHSEDKISIVSYSGVARLILPPVSASRTDDISAAIDHLQASGRTHLSQGIRIAYQTAETHFVKGGNNRIILATDGGFTFRPSLLRKVARKYNRDIPLSVFFLGKKVLPKSLRQLEDLARAGGGNYAHIIPETAKESLESEARALDK